MTLIAGAIAVITLYLLLQMFRSANPAVLARTIKFGGGVVALAVAAFTGLRGELAVAIPLGLFGAGLLGWTPLANAGFGNIGSMFGGGATRSSSQSSRVRSQFLGLQPGAGRDDISRAHKSLMKKLHPDQGGSTYLAARVNEAKDTLLRTHNG